MAQKQLIYIVDDEVLIARTLADIFEESGYETEYFTRPDALLEAARRQPPDVLVSDYAMPELSGIELARRIFGLYPTCRIFLLSATELALIETCVAKAPTPDFTFFSKPVHVVTLVDAVAHALRTVMVRKGESAVSGMDSNIVRTFCTIKDRSSRSAVYGDEE
jgi:FixJ family two-component response regulator